MQSSLAAYRFTAGEFTGIEVGHLMRNGSVAGVQWYLVGKVMDVLCVIAVIPDTLHLL